MEYLELVEKTWRHRELADATRDYVGLVQYATLAPSSHNTQPWKFKLEAGRITILPDLSRCCPEVDPDEHHLYASLGCAAENLLLAAQAAGLAGHACYDPVRFSLAVDFEPATPLRSPLFEAIPRRQCSRTQYDGTRLAADSIRLLADAAHGDGISVVFLTEPEEKEQVAEYVAAGNAAQFADARWAREMKKWIRFNTREAARTGDGLLGAALDIPNLPRWLGEFSMSVAASAKSQSRKDTARIRSSGAIAVVCSEANDRQHWIAAGRSYERLALQATALA